MYEHEYTPSWLYCLQTFYLKQFRETRPQILSVNWPELCWVFIISTFTMEDIFGSAGTNKIKDGVLNVCQKTCWLGSDHWGLTKQIPTVHTHYFTFCQFLLKFSFNVVILGCDTATPTVLWHHTHIYTEYFNKSRTIRNLYYYLNISNSWSFLSLKTLWSLCWLCFNPS